MITRGYYFLRYSYFLNIPTPFENEKHQVASRAVPDDFGPYCVRECCEFVRDRLRNVRGLRNRGRAAFHPGARRGQPRAIRHGDRAAYRSVRRGRALPPAGCLGAVHFRAADPGRAPELSCGLFSGVLRAGHSRRIEVLQHGNVGTSARTWVFAVERTAANVQGVVLVIAGVRHFLLRQKLRQTK